MADDARRQRFEAAYRELYAPICGYALRRVSEPEDDGMIASLLPIRH